MAGEPLSVTQLSAKSQSAADRCKDGLFHPSCLAHGIKHTISIRGITWLQLLGDWYVLVLLVLHPSTTSTTP